jgi:hypothetical protein
MIANILLSAAALVQSGQQPNTDELGDKVGDQIAQEVLKGLQQQHVGEQVGQQVADAMRHVPWHQVTVIGALTGVLVPLALFTLVGMIIFMQVRKSQAQTRSRLELQKQLLDKFSSGREFGEFLESQGGQRFLQDAFTPVSPQAGSNVRWIRTGTFLSIFGLGLLCLAWLKHGFAVGGAVILAAGLGFLISGAVSHRLAQQWTTPPSGPAGPQPLSQS